MPTQGQLAPDFSLPDQDGNLRHLADFRGKWALLYFYPKDDTAGCTAEACGLRDSLPDFKGLDAVVLGISADSAASHKAFADKYGLPFMLLADEDKQVIKAYGAWREKNIYGKKMMGIARTSFLIDPEGKIAKIYERVEPENHAREVLEDLESLKK